MTPEIALALLTCDRYDYTVRTVQSFLDHQPFLDQFVLLHGDDASTDPRVVSYVQAQGFETVLTAKTAPDGTLIRRGWLKARTALLWHAATRADWIFYLENDCETLRMFPWHLFHQIADNPKVDCLRLYGVHKDLAGKWPTGLLNKVTRKPIKWKRLKHAVEPAEVGFAHWGAQPSVTRSPAVLKLHYDGTPLAGATVRVLENVTCHIGDLRTKAIA